MGCLIFRINLWMFFDSIYLVFLIRRCCFSDVVYVAGCWWRSIGFGNISLTDTTSDMLLNSECNIWDIYKMHSFPEFLNCWWPSTFSFKANEVNFCRALITATDQPTNNSKLWNVAWRRPAILSPQHSNSIINLALIGCCPSIGYFGRVQSYVGYWMCRAVSILAIEFNGLTLCWSMSNIHFHYSIVTISCCCCGWFVTLDWLISEYIEFIKWHLLSQRNNST